jgi:hypothetical protein
MGGILVESAYERACYPVIDRDDEDEQPLCLQQARDFAGDRVDIRNVLNHIPCSDDVECLGGKG